MSTPANIRINVKAPFPSLVYGAGPITVIKQNGVWTIGYNIMSLAPQTPPAGRLATDYVAFYDSTAKSFFLLSIAQLGAIATSYGVPQRSITSAADLPVQTSDVQLNFNVATDLVPMVPLASSMPGRRLVFKNLAGSHVQTITRIGTDTFDRLTTWPLQPTATLALTSYNDGVNTGWGIG